MLALSPLVLRHPPGPNKHYKGDVLQQLCDRLGWVQLKSDPEDAVQMQRAAGL